MYRRYDTMLVTTLMCSVLCFALLCQKYEDESEQERVSIIAPDTLTF
jgi:hypothetical protein